MYAIEYHLTWNKPKSINIGLRLFLSIKTYNIEITIGQLNIYVYVFILGFYCDCYISQIKIYLDSNTKFSILDVYSFNDDEEDAQALTDFDYEIALDESLQQAENKRHELSNELSSKQRILEETQQKIDDIQKSLQGLN